MTRTIEYNFNYVNGLYFELLSDEGHNDTYDVQFIDRANYDVIHTCEMQVMTWVKLNRKYLSDIKIVVKFKDAILLELNVLELIRGKRVFISFESKSLGDTLAWMPVCEQFRKEYNCEVIVSTFMNQLFESKYPEIKFVGRGVVVDNIIAMLEIGWFYDKDKEPIHPATIPLQQSAKNILCIKESSELICDIAYDIKERPIKGKYICISIHSTAQLKHWYYWQELIDWHNQQGIEVIEVSKEKTEGLYRYTELKDKSLQNVMNYLYHAEYFIGLSSGISWLAWALRKRVYMIANFTNKEHEFQSNCIRITNDSVCNGCWNNPMFKFDKGNWNYCPEHEDTPRQFECHKKISANKIIEIIKYNYHLHHKHK